MDTKALILKRLDETCRSLNLNDTSDLQWEDGQLIRNCAIRAERGDPSGWIEFASHLESDRDVARGVAKLFEELGWARFSTDDERTDLTLPSNDLPVDDQTKRELIALLNPGWNDEDEPPTATKRGVIMYIEEKPELNGHARIGRVTFSASKKTIYYAERKLQSLKGGYKANYYDVDTGLHFWISNCKKDGNDTLYPGIVEIDEDAREEYWIEIRNKPENVHLTKFRSEGKYAKRRPS